MAYEWTKKQIAQLTVGCTVMAEFDVTGEAEPREIAKVYNVTKRGTFKAKCLQGLVMVSDEMNPSTIQPPSLATLNRMAVESFGEQSHVSDLRGFVEVFRRDEFGRLQERAAFYGADAARECARWLAARGR